VDKETSEETRLDLKLEEFEEQDIEDLCEAISDELNRNRSSIANINRFMRLNELTGKSDRQGFDWSYALSEHAPTNTYKHMIDFTFNIIGPKAKSFELRIGLPEFAECDEIEDFEITFERFEKGEPISVADLREASKNGKIIH